MCSQEEEEAKPTKQSNEWDRKNKEQIVFCQFGLKYTPF